MNAELLISMHQLQQACACTLISYSNYFYCSNDDASTSLNILSFVKCKKNVSDMYVELNVEEGYNRIIFENKNDNLVYGSTQ